MVNKNNLINGNTVLAPDYTETEKDYKKQRKIKTNKPKQIKRKQINKGKVILNILVTFIIGTIIICRYSSIYNMQRNLASLKTETTSLKKENENLKVELIKYCNLQHIEDKAIKELNMVKPDKFSSVYVDLKTDNFKKENKTNGKSDSNNISKIYKLIKNIFAEV